MTVKDLENLKKYDEEMVVEHFFEKYGRPTSYDSWPSFCKQCYKQGLYLGIITSIPNAKEEKKNDIV